MIISRQIEELRNAVANLQSKLPGAKIGFVPTMGALHEGHLALVKKAAENADIVVVSIFVNPTQFNDKADLAKYPRTLEADVKKLQGSSCHVLFCPTEDVIYPDGPQAYSIDLDGIDLVMEGKFRPGHFNGVAMVVERLFSIVNPDQAFFGLKDFQQVAVIRKMVKIRQMPVEIVAVEIVRSDQGLALSSRNMLLSDQQKQDALIIYQTLQFGRELSQKGMLPEKVTAEMKQFFETGALKLEYLEIVDQNSLRPAETFERATFCCIAAFCGSIRLIDNMQLS